MHYDDLLNIPYKTRGRDKSGFDCYGLVLEMCKRNNTPLIDMFKDIENISQEYVNDYISNGLNVKKIENAKVGAIIETVYNGNAHIGFIVEHNKVIHATKKGVRITPLFAFDILGIYEVI